MAVSILHRISGQGMAFVGLPVLLWWLGAMASGPEAYETFHAAASSWFGYVVLVGLTWTFFTHLCSGIRHFVLDTGAGYELESNKLWSIATLLLPILMTAAFWAAILLK